MQPLSPLDHSAILDCVNPKAFWYCKPGLSATPLKASLALVLRDYPLLAGRMDGGSRGLAAMRKHLALRISLCNAGTVRTVLYQNAVLYSTEAKSFLSFSLAAQRAQLSQLSRH